MKNKKPIIKKKSVKKTTKKVSKKVLANTKKRKVVSKKKVKSRAKIASVKSQGQSRKALDKQNNRQINSTGINFTNPESHFMSIQGIDESRVMDESRAKSALNIKNPVLLSFATLGQSLAHNLVEITKQVDSYFSATELSRWMDVSSTGAGFGGRFHRVVFGHDYLSNISEVFDKFGLKAAVIDYPLELLKDAATPAGIPLPGVQALVESKMITLKQGATWGSVNLGQILAGGFAFYSTYKLKQYSDNGDLKDPVKAGVVLLVTGSKLVTAISTTNILMALSVLADAGILLNSISDLKIANQVLIEKIKQILQSQENKFSFDFYCKNLKATRA